MNWEMIKYIVWLRDKLGFIVMETWRTTQGKFNDINHTGFLLFNMYLVKVKKGPRSKKKPQKVVIIVWGLIRYSAFFVLWAGPPESLLVCDWPNAGGHSLWQRVQFLCLTRNKSFQRIVASDMFYILSTRWSLWCLSKYDSAVPGLYKTKPYKYISYTVTDIFYKNITS